MADRGNEDGNEKGCGCACSQGRSQSGGATSLPGDISRSLGGKFGKKAASLAKGSGPLRPLEGSGLEDEMVFDFDVNEYDFRTSLQEILEIERCDCPPVLTVRGVLSATALRGVLLPNLF